MCDPGASGYPDRKTDTPITVTIAEDSLTIDDETQSRSIISCTGVNGTTTYLINGATSNLRNSERRAALAKAAVLLDQLRDYMHPLITQSEHSTLAAEGLGYLYNWFHDERKRLTEQKV
jgi:hypothetical protein